MLLHTAPQLVDFSNMPRNYTQNQWTACMDAIRGGNVVRVPEWLADYFRDVIPPRAMFKAGFIHCEGEDFPDFYWKLDGQWYVVHPTSTARPAWDGASAEEISQRSADMAHAWREDYRPIMIHQILNAIAASRVEHCSQLQACLREAIEVSGFSVSGPADHRAAENGEPIWVCRARELLAE